MFFSTEGWRKRKYGKTRISSNATVGYLPGTGIIATELPILYNSAVVINFEHNNRKFMQFVIVESWSFFKTFWIQLKILLKMNFYSATRFFVHRITRSVRYVFNHLTILTLKMYVHMYFKNFVTHLRHLESFDPAFLLNQINTFRIVVIRSGLQIAKIS